MELPPPMWDSNTVSEITGKKTDWRIEDIFCDMSQSDEVDITILWTNYASVSFLGDMDVTRERSKQAESERRSKQGERGHEYWDADIKSRIKPDASRESTEETRRNPGEKGDFNQRDADRRDNAQEKETCLWYFHVKKNCLL